ncbi:MAG: LysM peptidoglycan-binding domain-containing protein [Anaerolineales bacterium]|nr:LysM peptidoglycan-binding domain-containing protein [Anaerolineales bacterium]
MISSNKYLYALIVIILIINCSSCVPDIPLLTLTPSPTWQDTHTPSLTTSFDGTLTPVILVTRENTSIKPSPTPIIYTVKENDNLTIIANHYGVEVDKLILSNPDTNPNLLTVGMTLTIPIGEIVPSGIPTPTPLPLTMLEPICYRTNDPGYICFINVKNTLNQPVENITAEVSLYDDKNNLSYKTIASAVLNVLYPNQSIPIIARFSNIKQEVNAIDYHLQSANPMPLADNRYIPIDITSKSLYISSTGISAKAQGTISVRSTDKMWSRLTIVAIAYDKNGQIVGVRKQYLNQNEKNLKKIPFLITVYSLGNPISDVSLFGEAIP